jgi:hypothetical protein
MSGESQSAPNSRLSLSNRADEQNRRVDPSTVRMAEQPSEGFGAELREEVTYDKLDGVGAVDWAEATDRFRTWYDDARGSQIVIENEVGDRTSFRTPNRFTPDYREMLYAKAQSLERGLRERWGKLLHTAMLTLSASSTDDSGNPLPPVEQLDELLSSWEAVRRALSRVLDGREWEYLAILEPHESGYVHIHLGVFVKGPVVAEQFQDVIDAHLRNCDLAGEEAHEIVPETPDESAVTVRRASHPSRQDGIQNLGAYLAAYMAGEYGKEATEMPEHVQRFYTVMWATGRQWFRPSNGAQELMQPPEDDDDELEELQPDWEVVGLAPDGKPDEEVIEFDPREANSHPYRRLRRDRGTDPPPSPR